MDLDAGFDLLGAIAQRRYRDVGGHKDVLDGSGRVDNGSVYVAVSQPLVDRRLGDVAVKLQPQEHLLVNYSMVQ